MRVAIKRWGNSASIRIPRAVMQAAQLDVDQVVEIKEESGRIVIEPVQRKYDLAALLDAITPDNLHEAVDFGKPVGKEIW